MKDSYKVSDSDKYLANVLFVCGFGCCSLTGGVVLEILKKGDFTFLKLGAILTTAILLTMGFVLMLTGWFILGKMEEKNAKSTTT
jgi:hypothetical protein